jgi:hypothetical protein
MRQARKNPLESCMPPHILAGLVSPTMEEKMAQSQAQRAETGEEQQTKSFSKKPPTTLYDNGHGTRVVRWDEGVSNLMIERSYKP